ncbi:hypothetical protein [Halorussus caseinilyticus]|uniref:Rubrerythrin-like domain-containing protein n=1 Tax=Halorussus caseinilyticus TaxID=3034025 RepID=A0ABD5WIM4_9EURY|nr:hypothetical protein [Halorussus sp. DT72]
MDLKDITRGLRGGDETRKGDQSRTTADARPGAAQSSTSDPAEATTNRTDSASDDATDPDRDDEHVCSFCQAEFDADRGVCPECDAEIVFRGTR